MYNLFIFRRDFRLYDNTGLNYAMTHFNNIIPIFIFTPEQITTKNKYISSNSLQFLVESLNELDNDLKKYNSKLHIFYGDNITILNKIKSIIKIDNIIENMDYTPYAIIRSNDIKKIEDINYILIQDYLLSNIGELNKKNGDPYLIYTPFYNNSKKYIVKKPVNNKINNLIYLEILNNIPTINYNKFLNYNKNIIYNGGRKNGLFNLNNIKNLSNYNSDRNTLSISTSLLSAYIKYGCISIREVYWKIKDIYNIENELLSQIYWREFYFYIIYYFPNMLKGYNFNSKFDNIKWINNINHFKKWCNSQTGFPIVDACMKELIITGYMHNRGRLITSNFLNRILGIDWRKGEQYFANQLVDYDPSINNGNWQWIASVGVDPKPFSQRLFNPWIQSKKFDNDCIYIKKWLPELKDIPSKHLHQWDVYCTNYDLKKINYCCPIVDYKSERQRSLKQYKKEY
jgi:deoxyribodipyrimidine photo-lyase